MKIYNDFAKMMAYKSLSNSFVYITEKSQVNYLSREAELQVEYSHE